MTLNEIRAEIDQIDNQMKTLFLKRMECAEHVAQTKAESGGDVFAPEREKEILEKRTVDTDGEIKSIYTSFLTWIMCASRKYQYGFLKNMQEDVLEKLLSQAGFDMEAEHEYVRVGFFLREKKNSLNLYINMISLNGIDIREMNVAEKDGGRKVSILLAGNVQDTDMRRLLCQLGKEAPCFEIQSLEK